jgi:hypothetical protein
MIRFKTYEEVILMPFGLWYMRAGMRNNRLYYNILQYIVNNILYWLVRQYKYIVLVCLTISIYCIALFNNMNILY